MDIIHGDCIEEIKKIPDNSIDSIVTDPPYELGFMGKKWDSTGIANNVEMWAECLRVLKPGGHLLAFSGTRTYHRMAVAIEDAGFEIRDMIEWVYGSGFPKSLNIGKAIDKQRNVDIEPVRSFLRSKLSDRKEIAEICGVTVRQVDHWIKENESQPQVPSTAQWEKLKAIFEINERPDIQWENLGKIIGEVENPITWFGGDKFIREPTEKAKQWEGWGTALKPAHEPICMARKPLAEKTVAENCLKWGTGGINIDESRVGTTGARNNGNSQGTIGSNSIGVYGKAIKQDYNMGRFPANLIHDNSEEVRECFPETNRIDKRTSCKSSTGMFFEDSKELSRPQDTGGNASRFFKSIIYQAKASKSERNKGCDDLEKKDASKMSGGEETRPGRPTNHPMRTNHHPTVKPIALMEYLIKMVTPKGGVVLDPFMGSGSTGVAAKKNNYDFIGIEMEKDYIEIAKKRILSI